MLTIENSEDVPLLPKYHKIHNICAAIYDQLVVIGKSEEFSSFRVTNFDIPAEINGSINDLQNGLIDPLSFLSSNQMSEALVEVLIKNTTSAILADFASFIYESLSSAKRGKMTVAYSLIRKPFLDELLIFEQMLIDKVDFVDRFFYKGDPKAYDPARRDLKGAPKLNIINKAVGKLLNSWLLEAEQIYSLRYDKSNYSSVDSISNRTLHIVTTSSEYATDRQNFNFVFSSKNDIERYWDHYYYFVPYLLLYSVEVIDAIVFSHINNDTGLREIRALIRIMALSYIFEESEARHGIDKIINLILNSLNLKCYSCNSDIPLVKEDIDLLVLLDTVLCPNCFENQIFSTDFIRAAKEIIETLNYKRASL